MKNTLIHLLKVKRFAPYFWTQFLGAFNDNVFKNALIIIITFQTAELAKGMSDMLVNVCMGIFILPFFLFSATAGQFADKYEKSTLIRNIKLLEIFIMIMACIGLFFHSIYFLLGVLFLLGLQATLFGPVKYGILPQQLKPQELIAGNGLVETGTFLAILIGTMVGGILISIPHIGWIILSIVMLSVSIAGWLISFGIPKVNSYTPDLNIRWNPFRETRRNIHFAKEKRSVFLSILGNSWFWFYGSVFLAQLPNYTRMYLGGSEHIVTLLLVLFSIGIGVGSLLCDRMSGHKIELGLVPFGSIGLTIFAITLFFLSHTPYTGNPLLLSEFLQIKMNWLILSNIVVLGMFGGFYIVPLFAIIQDRSEKSIRARIISANNILNALFMVLAALFSIGFLKLGLTIPQLFLLTGIINAGISIYIYTLVPEFSMRFLIWLIVSVLYKLKTIDIDKNIPEEGPAVIICNHISFIDALIIMAAIKRPIRFVMDHRIFKIPVLNFIFKTAKAIPIAPAKEDPLLKAKAFDSIAHALTKNELVGLFPEGAITYDGNIQSFRPGIKQIIDRTPVPVIPLAIRGLWGSFFSRKEGKAMRGLPRKLRAKITLIAAPPILPDALALDSLQQQVEKLRGEEK